MRPIHLIFAPLAPLVAFQEKVERRGEGEEVGCVSCGFWDLVVCLGFGRG